MMHIALTIDSKFVRYCAVTIVSILENNDPKISCYILASTKEDVLNTISTSYIPRRKNFKIMGAKDGCLLLSAF